MTVTLSKQAGFCTGVRNAEKKVNELIHARRDNERILTLGKLIHNRLYNDALLARGVRSVEFEEALQLARQEIPTTLIIRTHGVIKEQDESLRSIAEKNPLFRVVDATCPFVKRIHKLAEAHTDENTFFVLFGVASHPEVVGILSYAKGDKTVISSVDEVEALDLKGKTPILCSQTTQNSIEYEKIKKIFKKLYTNSIFFDTICSVTENRQNEAIEIAKRSEVMIVIGGKDSSNTHRLYELCREQCSDTRWIESYEELITDFPDNAKSVGITAGASTPDGIITEVLNLWKKTKM